MSQSIITTAFEQWKAQEAAGGHTVVLDEFVLANVPGLDPDAPIARTEGLPPAEQIVHRQRVNKTGVVNNNAVVYSVTIGTEIGDFDFNWIGLVNQASGTVAMIVHAPTQRKIANASGQQGNALTRSFLMEYDGAASETAISIPAETWQIDFTARLTGIDEMQRLINLDHYGSGAFFADGFLVVKTGQQYYVNAGNAYVGGLRTCLVANQNITVTTKPVKVWADVSLQGNVVSQWETVVTLTLAADLQDYQDNSGFMHRVFAVASIDVAGNITDLRPKGSLGDQQGKSDFLRKDDNLAALKDKAESRKSLELGALALKDTLTAQDVAALPMMMLPLDKDLNLIGSRDDRGIWFQQTDREATSEDHYPMMASGTLLVTPSAYGCQQEYTTYSGRKFIRGLTALWTGKGPWGEWVELYSPKYKPTLSDLGAAAANDVVSRTQGGTFEKALHVRDLFSAGNIKSESNIDAVGVVTSRSKIECRSPGSDAYAAGFRCYIKAPSTSITTDYVNYHPEYGEQWMFATNYTFATGDFELTARGNVVSYGSVRAGGPSGGYLDGNGNIAGRAWGGGGGTGDLLSFINNKIAGVLAQFGKRHFSGADYIRIPDVPGGLIIQWMSGPVSVAETVDYPVLAFPIAFPSACLMAFATTKGDDTRYPDIMFQTSWWNNSQVKVFPQWFGTGVQHLNYPLILAIGY